MARADARKKAASSSAAAAAVGRGKSSPDTTPDAGGGDVPLAFEAALSKLEEVVDRLEGGELDLEVALASFEEGVKLTRHCAGQLDAAERRIEVLMKEGDQFVARPFEETRDDADDDASDEEGWED